VRRDDIILIIIGSFLAGLGLILLFGVYIANDNDPTVEVVAFIAILLLCVGLPLLLIGIIKYHKKKKVLYANEMALKANKGQISEWINTTYPILIENLKVPPNSKIVTLYNVASYIFISNDSLCFFPTQSETIKFEGLSVHGNELTVLLESHFVLTGIKVNSIECFYPSGELFREHKITGGGSDIAGALVGGLIAGGVGAIIGSRSEVKSSLVTHDSREVILAYINNGQMETLSFNHFDYKTLNELIPQKSYDVLSEIKKQNIIQANISNTKTIPDQIYDLSRLKEDGIITENEFQSKKSELLTRL